VARAGDGGARAEKGSSGGSMDELRALSQRLQARNTGGRPSDSVIYGLGPRKTPRADDADDADADDADGSSEDSGSPTRGRAAASPVAASPPPLPGAGGRTPAGGQSRRRPLSEPQQAAGVGARLSARRSNSPPSPEPAPAERKQPSPTRLASPQSDPQRASKPLASALGTSLSILLNEALQPLQQAQQSMQAQLDELGFALEDRIAPLEIRQDEFAASLEALASRTDSVEGAVQDSGSVLSEHIAGSQEALTELEAALSERLDASRQEFFGSQEELAQDRNSQIELINGALATIEERLLSDVKAREEEVGLVCERLGIFEPFIYKCDLFTKTGSGQT
jgi:hypothetical protein